ncbi:MFS transporter [Shewanella dokdonensis]|uniref:MFS transporter n=1 Tax=Shewanella dokdonensis TaxID=712036 RepID=UPI0020100D7D|nr:MFS transporter [Shewanella dokdonensis]MCL1074936.1 MFS transporter [Shewanella dokdonensis]
MVDSVFKGLTQQKLALGAGFFAMLFANQSVQVLAIPFYQMQLGVDPFLLSLALALPVIAGTLITPWIGYVSDHWHGRTGKRRPLIMAGSLLSALLFGCIWMVPTHWPMLWQLSYFALFYLLFSLAAALVAVPTISLSYEISHDESQRAAIMAVNTYFIKLASVLYQWLFPLASLAIFGSVVLGIRWVGWGVALLLIGFMGALPALFCRGTANTTISHTAPGKPGFTESLQQLLHHKPLMLLMAICLLQLGGSVFAASMDYYLLVYFVSHGDIAQGAYWKGVLSSAYALTGFASVPLVNWLRARCGAVNALGWVLALTLLGGIAKWFLFVPEIGFWIVLDALLCTSVWTAMTTLIPALNAGLSDVETQLRGRPTAGMFASIYNSATSLASILALLASGATLNVIGFDATAGGAQSTHSITAMRWILTGGTVLFGILSLWCLHKYHIGLKDKLALFEAKD